MASETCIAQAPQTDQTQETAAHMPGQRLSVHCLRTAAAAALTHILLLQLLPRPDILPVLLPSRVCQRFHRKRSPMLSTTQ